MRELLPDNIALAERLAALPPGLAPPKPPGEREIRGDRALVTWLSSFATYVAIVAQAHPECVGDMLAYMRLIAREASKFGGTGWLTYDAVFRRNREGSSAPWNVIDALLHQVYVANQQEKVAVPCKHCQEVDHSDAECAVAAILPKPLSPPAGSLPSQRADRSTMGKGKRPAPYSRQRPVCTSWNAGNCRFPGKCAYAHVCANCYGSQGRIQDFEIGGSSIHHARETRQLGGSGGMLPRKILGFRPSEIVSDAIWGYNLVIVSKPRIPCSPEPIPAVLPLREISTR